MHDMIQEMGWNIVYQESIKDLEDEVDCGSIQRKRTMY